ncbi:MAG: DUF2799 domain-containing protein [Bdellovibrionaceae bacterium]|jgi:hypothetical protein|nr:DUF2799 domain-containing protein [Pseudobdellovibrionaceae bacterium]
MTRFFVIFSLISLISACSTGFSNKENCDHRDWFEVGRQDGSKGAQSDQFRNHVKSCKMIKKETVSLYKTGRNAGLAIYCQPQNAYELGKLNQAYHHVCPKALEEDFLASYKKGKTTYQKERSFKNNTTNKVVK